MEYYRVKRVLDFIFLFFSLPLWGPLMLVLAAVVKLSSKGPVFFKQKRLGRDKSHFMIYKFRSMYTSTPKDTPTHLLENPDIHITPVGRVLRKLSLDELPQIFNIIKGELTLVGPRPALWNQDDLIAERDKYRVNGLTPGLTGLAQVSGRDELPIDVKAKYDGEYKAGMCFALDMKILFLTVGSVFRSKGVVEGAN